MPVISRLLVANRGEIARRVFRTCRDAGIGTVAICSDPDLAAPYAAEADLVVHLPGASAARTYLNGPAIVAAALASGADAVHPGYGFLAEDPGFARAVLDAGLTWVGPPPEAMAAMALKVAARKTAAAAGIPVLPELDPEAITEYPVLVKASAGGGGRGMRAVSGPGELAGALESARREAQSAFGDGTVFCEPLVTGARHVEVQVLADDHGVIWALTERDCSVQRRYQKLIEESPSPAVGPELRERLLGAARLACGATGYRGAGTVEFLVSPAGEFYFLEFNTRLQVEHPVTELLHGIDIVAAQLDIAQGLPLPESPPPAAGHAIQARVYAEDPADGYRPTAGQVHQFSVPGTDAELGLPAGHTRSAREPGHAGQPSSPPVLRVDAAIVAGSQVSPHYDAMLAKVIAWAPARDGAVRRLADALSRSVIAGPPVNRDLLVAVLRDPVFAAGRADTSLLAGFDMSTLTPTAELCQMSALAAAIADAAANLAAARAAGASPGIPGGFRTLRSAPQRKSFESPRGQIDIAYDWTRSGIVPAPGSGPAPGQGPDDGGLTVADFSPGQVTLCRGGVRYRFGVTRAGQVAWVSSALGSVRLVLAERLPPPVTAAEPGSLLAPMPGSVVRVTAAQGEAVRAGQAVLVIEAMKMEHQVTAPAGGILTEVRVSAGTQVEAGDVLAIVAAEEK